jgi:DNA polymerase IIIc chi subunit
LLVLIVVRSAVNPSFSAAAARTYRYELVKVRDDQAAEQARMTIEKYTRDGWEVVSASFVSAATPGDWGSGYVIFRK